MNKYGWCLDWLKGDETREESMLKIKEWLNTHRVNYSVIYYPGGISTFRISTKDVLKMGLENAKELLRLHSILKEWPLECVDAQVERFFRENKTEMPAGSPTLRERFVEEFSNLVAERYPRRMGIKAIFNALMRRYPGRTNSSTPKEFMSWFMKLNICDLIEINGFGVIRIKTVLNIQEKIMTTDGMEEKLLEGCSKIT